MNPIHEAGAASLMLSLFCATPVLFVLALVALARDSRADASTVWRPIHAFCAVLFVLACALVTLNLHDGVERAISSGGYGAPADVRRQYAAEIVEWHASANAPVYTALVVSALTALVANARTLWRKARRTKQPTPT